MRSRIRLGMGLLAAGLVLASCGTAPDDRPDPADDARPADVFEASLIENGREIAERNCAVCHSIERQGESSLAEAPPLRMALVDFDIEALATDFREHVEIGNDVMPEFDFSPLHTDALMAYLLSIEDVQTQD